MAPRVGYLKQTHSDKTKKRRGADVANKKAATFEEAPPPRVETLPLSEIREDAEIQPREAIDPGTVHHYSSLMVDGVQFPPLDVFGDEHLLADGYQRLAAARQAGFKSFDVRIHCGGRREAVLFAASANARHGLPLSNSDKRRVVTRMLRDPEWLQWSSNNIAKHCGCGHKLVDTIRAELAPSLAPGASENRTFRTKHGTTAKMRTGKIGKGKSAAAKSHSQAKSVSAIRARYTTVNGTPRRDEPTTTIVATEPPEPPAVVYKVIPDAERFGSSLKIASGQELVAFARFIIDRTPKGRTKHGSITIKIEPNDLAEFDRLLAKVAAVIERPLKEVAS